MLVVRRCINLRHPQNLVASCGPCIEAIQKRLHSMSNSIQPQKHIHPGPETRLNRISHKQRQLKTSRIPNPVHQSVRQTSTSTEQEHTAKENTYDSAEVEKFARLASAWWDESGEFGALHSLNALRVPLVRDALQTQTAGEGTEPLAGLKLVDVGCGGGILSEPLARLGAEVLGLDASAENTSVAAAHASHDSRLSSRLTYRTGLVEDLAVEQGAVYDAVVASEILEHVADVKVFLSSCCALIKPGGSLFVTTINRTRIAYLLGVLAAERLLCIVPQGAHDWNKFVTPEELQARLLEDGLETRLIHGMQLNPLNLRWRWSGDTSINYALHAVKE